MLLSTPFEKLHTTYSDEYRRGDGGSVQSLDVEDTYKTMDSLIAKSKTIHDKWQYNRVDCRKNKVAITDDFSLQYVDVNGVRREEDITDFAFQELCTRVGVPSQYVKKCYEAGKKELALENFRSWAGEFDGGLQVMRLPNENGNHVVRAVTSDKFSSWDSYKVLSNLKRTINLDRWALIQSHLSEDKLVLRFIDRQSPIFEDKNSKLFVGVCVRTSDVGKGSLFMKMFIYRQACTNGMIVSEGDATLYRQSHSGSAMSESKIEAFVRAMLRAEKYGNKFANGIERCIGESMNELEFNLWIDKTSRELKLSKKATEKLQGIVDTSYDRNMWGLINGVTELAHDFTLDKRMEMESWAGSMFGARA